MSYVDCFVLALPKDKVDVYRKQIELSASVWREHGALSYQEAIGEDVQPGKVTSFPQAVLLEPNEAVVVAWITYESRAKRDEVLAKVMKDPRLADLMKPDAAMPFDGKRMFWGGFETLIQV